MIDPPPGLHRDDYLHEGETAKQWLASCTRRTVHKSEKYVHFRDREVWHERREDNIVFVSEYEPGAIVEDLTSMDPEFDRQGSERYERIMAWFDKDTTCCPGFSYLPSEYCPQHGGMQ